MQTWLQALIFTVSILASFLILYGIATLLMWLVRRFFPTSWSYLWRQGLANLYRPNNQTTILIVSVGLGTSLICTLFFIQTILLTRVKLSSSGNQPNMVLFDIQSHQKDGVLAIAKAQNVPINQSVPIVNMRLEEINGKTAADSKATRQPSSRAAFSGGNTALHSATRLPLPRRSPKANGRANTTNRPS